MIENIVRFMFLIVAFVPLCGAWESEIGVFPSSLVADLQSELVVSEVGITVKNNTTYVRYVFYNSGKNKIFHTFTIYNPVFSWAGVGAEYPDRNFPEISMLENGKLIKRQDRVSALYEGIDVTNMLKRAGLNPDLPGYGDEAIISQQFIRRSKKIQGLVKGGILIKAGASGLPNWKLFTTYSWRTEFPSKKPVELVLKFKTRPTFRLLNKLEAQDKGVLYSNCAPNNFINNLSEQMSDSYVLREYKINFDIENQNLSDVDVDISSLIGPDSGKKHVFYCNMPFERQSGNYANGKTGIVKAKGGLFSFVTLEEL